MAISMPCPSLSMGDFPPELKTIVLLHLKRPQTLKALTDSINYDGYVHFSVGIVHTILKRLDREFFVTVRRKDNDDWWYIKKQGVDFLKDQGLI